MKLSNHLFKIDPFSLPKRKKNKFFLEQIKKNFKYHIKNCDHFKNGLNLNINSFNNLKNLHEFPFIPVNVFKKLDLRSSKSNNGKFYNSSGTTSSKKSKIFLDKNNTINQSKALNLIGKNFLGKTKKIFVVVDSKENLFNGYNNARTAAILGFSIFALKTYFILDSKMKLKVSDLRNIYLAHKDEEIIFFGFTSILWENFLSKLIENKFTFKKSLLLHGGGWKKMDKKKVSEKKFNKIVKQKLHLNKIINYYGMIEQTGSIFFKCNYGYFHCSNLSDIFIRDKDLKLIKNKKKGFVQLLSLLPTSYPGNSIITEDIGEIIGEDNCKCKRQGKYFKIYGRAPKAELRGCSDASN